MRLMLQAEIFTEMLENKQISLRPGVAEVCTRLG